MYLLGCAVVINKRYVHVPIMSCSMAGLLGGISVLVTWSHLVPFAHVHVYVCTHTIRRHASQGFLKLTKSCSHFYRIVPNTADIKAGFCVRTYVGCKLATWSRDL